MTKVTSQETRDTEEEATQQINVRQVPGQRVASARARVSVPGVRRTTRCHGHDHTGRGRGKRVANDTTIVTTDRNVSSCQRTKQNKKRRQVCLVREGKRKQFQFFLEESVETLLRIS